MCLFCETVISAAVCIVIFLPLYAVKRRLRSSLDTGRNVRAEIVISAEGGAEGLQQAVSAAVRELEIAPFLTHITLRCRNLTPEARAAAEILCRENDNIFFTEETE